MFGGLINNMILSISLSGNVNQQQHETHNNNCLHKIRTNMDLIPPIWGQMSTMSALTEIPLGGIL